MRSSTHASGTRSARVPLEHAPHLDPDSREVPIERRTVALDEAEVDEGDRQTRMRLHLTRQGPPNLAAGLGSWRSGETGAAEQVNEEVKAAGGCAADFVQGDRSEALGLVPSLLDELAAGGVLETLVRVHVAARQEPCAREGTGGLFHDEDPTDVIDAADDRADAGALPAQGPLPLAPSATSATAISWAWVSRRV